MLSFSPKQRSNLALAFLFIPLITGCLNPHMINRWVAHHYSPDALASPKRRSDQIVVKSEEPDMGMQLSTTEKKWTHVVPLIVYWHYDYRNTCALNPQIPVNSFIAAVSTYGGKLKGKLNGGRLELTIQQLPTTFVVDDRGWMVFPGFGAEYLSIQPFIIDLVVSYRLLDAGNAEIKTGTIRIADPDRPAGLKMWHSLKKMTWQYLDTYDANITAISKKFVDKLVTEL